MNIKRFCDMFFACIGRFKADTSGNIAIIFAVASLAIFAGVGAGVDLSRAYAARQRLSEVATLACQFSTRASVAQTANSTYTGTNGFQTYVNAVNSFATSSLSSQHWSGTLPGGGNGAPAGSYFTATPAATPSNAATSTGPTNPAVEMTASIPTTFMQILHVTQLPVHSKVNCSALASTPPIVNPPLVLQEGFETPCASYCDTLPSGASGTQATPTSVFPAAPSYTGANGTKWYIMGYCLETDINGVINSTTPELLHSAELDCDNGSNSAGNSSISTNAYLAAGNYELRYFYRARVDYPDYDPTYICGSTASDVSWANDTNSNNGNIRPNALRTNQMNVYLDMNLNGTAPLHTTIDGSERLAGSNLIDMCVYATSWVERSVRIKVTTPAYYWLSFAADGANDSFGAQLDNVRLCQGTCPGSLQDNFPTYWLAANNYGVNKTLFEDTFESPVYTPDNTHYLAKSGNLNSSYGVASGSVCGESYLSPPGWPCQPATGWATAPYNQVNYSLQGAAQGSQYIEMDGWNGFSTGNASRNRLISRPFLLDPGYYQVSYNYISDVNFTAAGAYGTNCYAAPASGFIFAASIPNLAGFIRFYQSTISDGTTNIVGVYMSHSQLVSTPITGGSLGSLTSYTNPDGTTSTTPTVAPDGVSWPSYNASVVNPVLDVCGYVDSFRWVPRTVSIKISKPGFYWLTFSANGGAADGDGGGIDDVKLTALGSPFMSNPPTSPLVAIPVPDPQPDTSYSPAQFPGYSIVADPFMPPAASQ